MKHIICVLLAAAMLFTLCACGFPKEQAKDTVKFYYPRKEITYGSSDSVISSEAREAQGYTTDLPYLLLLYLHGPASSELHSPFPAGLELVQVEQDGDTLYLILGSSLDSLSSLEKTLACACLTLTCLELSDATTVNISTEAGIEAGEKPIVMDSSCLIFWDDSAAETITETVG